MKTFSLHKGRNTGWNQSQEDAFEFWEKGLQKPRTENKIPGPSREVCMLLLYCTIQYKCKVKNIWNLINLFSGLVRVDFNRNPILPPFIFTHLKVSILNSFDVRKLNKYNKNYLMEGWRLLWAWLAGQAHHRFPTLSLILFDCDSILVHIF